MNLLNAYLRSPRVQRALNNKTKNSGFTLIELVIVVAILAILAAIGIPAFNDAQVRAREASAKTGLATAYKECAVSRLLGVAKHTALADGGGITYTAAKTDCTDSITATIEGGDANKKPKITLTNGAKENF